MAAEGASERSRARLAAFQLIEDVQCFTTGDAVERSLAEAASHGWPEVRLVLLYAACIRAEMAGGEGVDGWIEQLILAAGDMGADAMLAAALALRSEVRHRTGEPELREAGERDLARATALLDGAGCGALERATGQIGCGLAYGRHELWELEEERYAEAEQLLAQCEIRLLDALVLNNRMESYISIACGLRELGRSEELAALRRDAEASLTAVRGVPTTAAWMVELRVSGNLLAALVGFAAPEPAQALAAALEQSPHPLSERVWGSLRLTAALVAVDAGEWPVAASEAAAAAELLETVSAREPLRALALRLCAEAERALVGDLASQTLRYADYTATRRSQSRAQALHAARSRIRAEHLRVELDRHAEEALRDELTGVGNRRAYTHELGVLEREPRPLAVIAVDIDRFKQVNDRFGHAVGDEVIRRIAAALAAGCRPDDLVARIGGDEFAVLLPGVDDAFATRRATEILDRVAQVPWESVAAGLVVGVSIGVAAGSSVTPERLMRQADHALYTAKRQGRGRFVQATPA